VARGRRTLAAGDQVRLFKRVQEGKTVLGNNGDVVQLLYADTAGLRARNVATKSEASVSWQQLTPQFADLPALSYGYATTVYTACPRRLPRRCSYSPVDPGRLIVDRPTQPSAATSTLCH